MSEKLYKTAPQGDPSAGGGGDNKEEERIQSEELGFISFDGKSPTLRAVPMCKQTQKALHRLQTVGSTGVSIGRGGNCELTSVSLFEMKSLKQHATMRGVGSECLR